MIVCWITKLSLLPCVYAMLEELRNSFHSSLIMMCRHIWGVGVKSRGEMSRGFMVPEAQSSVFLSEGVKAATLGTHPSSNTADALAAALCNHHLAEDRLTHNSLVAALCP